jgi:hypothetical protein
MYIENEGQEGKTGILWEMVSVGWHGKQRGRRGVNMVNVPCSIDH